MASLWPSKIVNKLNEDEDDSSQNDDISLFVSRGATSSDSHDSQKFPWQRLSETSFRNIEDIIPKDVSHWMAVPTCQWIDTNGKQTAYRSIKDVAKLLGLETTNVSGCEFDSFMTLTDGSQAAEHQWYEDFFDTLNSHGNMDFDLRILYDSGNRANDPFRGWPKMVTADEFNTVKADISRSYQQVKNLMATYKRKRWVTLPWLDIDVSVKACDMLKQAANFQEQLCCFLMDPEKTESAVEDLFIEFARIANVKLLKGSAYKRKMKVLGVNVTSKPDLRMVNLPKEMKDLLPDLSQDPHASTKTTAVVVVKKDLPSDGGNKSGTSLLGTNGKVLGQIFGELLLELPHSKVTGQHHVFGILVRSTKVTFARLYMSNDMLNSIRFDRTAPPADTPIQNCHIKFSPAYDMLKRKDRVKILRRLYKLNWSNH